ncbi:unnamed protein product [Didymodactylos carnosus]|uniref:Mab-21-like HhH/H2TH-like domain-containing protein n=1 Tax=Didymodactylos carnosus TaxID=1234261 RepID=A0A8S2CQZ4_9BILA|nr:unnamed protein product [Didymodactylos carnosus]CAF3562852.1 unnamed protein product [Didymodactylos carnosus]
MDDILCGSFAEGVHNARDIDIMLCEGEVDSENELILTESPTFVRIKWNNVKLSHHSYGYDLEGVKCINGLKMKQKYNSEMVPLLSTSLRCLGIPHETESQWSNILRNALIKQSTDIGTHFSEMLQRTSSSSFQNRNFRILYDIIDKPLEQLMKKNQINTETATHINSYQLPLMFMGLIYGISIPNDCRLKVSAIIDFYYKYKHLSNLKISQNLFKQLINEIIGYKSSLVLSIKLNFWPNNVQPFLERIQMKQPLLYEKIKHVYMHVIPKWSKINCKSQDYEFCYSFSAVERQLATVRTLNGTKLYIIARNIYYKHLYNKVKTMKSYFVKTSVLWMCETIELDDENEILTVQWLEFFCNLLHKRCCPHYFMPMINIFDNCSEEDMDNALLILQNDIKPSEGCYTINAVYPIKKNINQINNEYVELFNDWYRHVHIEDIVRAINDWTQLKSIWFSIIENDYHFEELLLLLNSFALLDDNGKNNLLEWKQKFLDNNNNTDDQLTREWADSNRLTPTTFIFSIIATAYTSKWITNIVTNSELLENINKLDFTVLLRVINVFISQYQLFPLKSRMFSS